MLALRLPLRVAARAGAPQARLATPIVAPAAAAFAGLRSYAQAADKASGKKKPATKKPKEKIVKPTKEEKAAAAQLKKEAAKKAAKKAAYQALSDEEKAAISAKVKAKATKAEIKLLKAQALTPPKRHRVNSWTVYVQENIKDKINSATPITEAVKQMTEQYKAMSQQEMEHYKQLADEQTAKGAREYQEWINSHTPAQIHAANVARRQLRKKAPEDISKVSNNKYYAIKDERLVKPASNAFMFFWAERLAAEKVQGPQITDVSKMIGAEWKNLPLAEKKKYEDISAQDKERYARQCLEVYGAEEA